MLNPIAFRVRRSLDPSHAALAHGVQAIGDPIHVLLDGHDHLRLHRRTAGPGDREHVGEARDHQPEIGGRSAVPFLRQGGAVADADVDLLQRTGHRVEAGGEYDGVEFVFLSVRRAQAFRRQFLNRCGTGVDQRHVVAVVGLVIIRIQAKAFGADRVILRG